MLNGGDSRRVCFLLLLIIVPASAHCASAALIRVLADAVVVHLIRTMALLLMLAGR